MTSNKTIRRPATPPHRRRPWRLAAVAMLLATAGLASHAALVTLDPRETVEGRNEIVTSNPGIFTGPDVATLIGATRFYNAGITGQNTISANVEAGHIWNGHASLTHVTNFVTPAGTLGATNNRIEYDRHATWVGMMIGGRTPAAFAGGPSDPVFKGIAYGTDLRSGAFASSWTIANNPVTGLPEPTRYRLGFGATFPMLVDAYSAFFGTADVINSSWGGSDTFGISQTAVITDGLANQNRFTTFVTSAGNTGPGAKTVGTPGSAYNNITVGALQNVGNVYNTMASFSSRGPMDWAYTPDGNTLLGAANVRAAVDIVAPGTTLTSAFYGGTTGGNVGGSDPGLGSTAFSQDVGGTSFAAPIVAGGVALLVSGSKADTGMSEDSRDARVIKAVLMNSADKIPGWNNGQSLVSGVVRTTQSLDWASGAGALNLDRAFDQYLGAGTRDVPGLGGGSVGAVGWDYGEVGFGQTSIYAIDEALLGGSRFTVTLSWFRERTANFGNLNLGPMLVANDIGQANLDLFLWDSDGNTKVGESISLFNDVEHLSFLLPRTARYEIRVQYTDNLFGNLSSEQFGLAWAGVAVPTPGTLGLLLAGVFAAGFVRRRRALH